MNPPTTELVLKAWGNFPSGVSVVTFYDEQGRVHGLTANAVCSVRSTCRLCWCASTNGHEATGCSGAATAS